jgi:hypothetical protein
LPLEILASKSQEEYLHMIGTVLSVASQDILKPRVLNYLEGGVDEVRSGEAVVVDVSLKAMVVAAVAKEQDKVQGQMFQPLLGMHKKLYKLR